MTTEKRQDERTQHTSDRRCQGELHLRLCARQLPTGHLQFGWRVERWDPHGVSDGASLEGTFGPFQLPHECGQEVAAVVRKWMKATHRAQNGHGESGLELGEGEQLTLREFLVD